MRKKLLIFTLLSLSSFFFLHKPINATKKIQSKHTSSNKLTLSAAEAFNNVSKQNKNMKKIPQSNVKMLDLKVNDELTLQSLQYKNETWEFSPLPKTHFEILKDKTTKIKNQYGVMTTQHTFKVTKKGVCALSALNYQIPLAKILPGGGSVFNYPQVTTIILIIN